MNEMPNDWFFDIKQCIEAIYGKEVNIQKYVSIHSLGLKSKEQYLTDKFCVEEKNKYFEENGWCGRFACGPVYNGWGDVYGSPLNPPFDEFENFVIENLFENEGRVYYGQFGSGSHCRFLIMIPFDDYGELNWNKAKHICHTYGVS